MTTEYRYPYVEVVLGGNGDTYIAVAMAYSGEGDEMGEELKFSPKGTFSTVLNKALGFAEACVALGSSVEAQVYSLDGTQVACFHAVNQEEPNGSERESE